LSAGQTSRGDSPAEPIRIRVLVISAVRLYREGLEELLGRDSRLRIAAEAPDVVLLDTASSDGLGAVRRVSASIPEARIVALGVSETPGEVLALAEAGIAGYVTREASAEHVAEAVWRAANDELACSPRVAASLLRHVRELAALRPPDAAGPGLTPREREIVGLIDEGLSNKQIASRLCIELPTVKNHVHNILEKLHVSRRGEAVARLRQSRRAAGV
jgi:two-component system, NarL family, nitrate/nitrite response regulator NarL